MPAFSMTLALALAPIIPTHHRGAAAVIPQGPWTLTQERLTCTVTKAYGSGATAQTLGFSNPGRRDIGKITIVSTAGYSGPSWRSDVIVTIGKGPPIDATASDTLQPDQRWLTEILPVKGAVIDPEQGNAIAIRLGTALPVTFAMPKARDAVQKLRACQDAIYHKWGIEPLDEDLIASGSGPIGDPAEWITSDDYPNESLMHEEEGKTMILWHIGIDGLASDCRVVESSGHPLLDKAACDAVVRNARYAPALDKNRKPIPSWSSRNVVWSLPK